MVLKPGKAIRMTYELIAATMMSVAECQAENMTPSDSGIVGIWRQIESNSGSCPSYLLNVGWVGPQLLVTANNGWSAILKDEQDGVVNGVTGVGRWRPTGRSRVAGKPFIANFNLLEPRLYMTMAVDLDDKSRMVIKAVFERCVGLGV